MNRRHFGPLLTILLFVLSAPSWASRPKDVTETDSASARPQRASTAVSPQRRAGSITIAQRKAAAAKLKARKQALHINSVRSGASTMMTLQSGAVTAPAMGVPQGQPDYFGMPNWTNSPLPVLDANGNVVSGGIRKFVSALPGLGPQNANDIGQYIPIAMPIKNTNGTDKFANSDYYEIGLREYTELMHKDLVDPATNQPVPTKFRGYVDLSSANNTPHYLGPLIIARSGRAVRVKFVNQLPTGTAGDLFIPTDTTAMGAGMGPDGMNMFTQNRAELHLHGGTNPWISDGTPHQWVVPAGENTPYKQGIAVKNVPDMPDPGDGALTYIWPNQQSNRLQFYHDHSFGITRLNVYAGEAAGYLIVDDQEDKLIDAGVLPGKNDGVYRYGIPLIIQDKTFVPPVDQLATTDPTWDLAKWGGFGQLWFPHVYMPNQNPADTETGANPFGRWDYGPWFWPPMDPSTLVGKPYACPTAAFPDLVCPGTPNPSLVPEAFMDTPVINGQPYPYLEVQPRAYRFRILNAANDRYWNLSLFYADPSLVGQAAGKEVKMIPAAKPASMPYCAAGSTPDTWTNCWPTTWPSDGRDGGVPDPATAGPAMIQIGSEGGFLPAPVTINPQPVNYNYNRRDIVVLNVSDKGLFLGPAERADVVIDFSKVPDGSKIILYNDSPAPVPAFDPRIDYYTGDPDQTDMGGAPSTVAGYGPNTRTIMQFIVKGTAGAGVDPTLPTAVANTYKATQPAPVVPEKAYGAPTNTYARIQSTSLTWTPAGSTTPVTLNLDPKAIQELFELQYGRMNATLGVELPFTNFNTQTTIPLGYLDPLTEKLYDSMPAAWKITHNGVDTHAIHFHLFNVQVVNRVGWDGAIRPPDPNELGWKETVRMNPLEDIVVAMQPVTPAVPFAVATSKHAIDPSMPDNADLRVTNPADGNAITVKNDPLTDWGWEYVWHCHLLGHEENDMMRPVNFQPTPKAQMITPAPGTVLPGSTTTFVWSPGTGVTTYSLQIGSTAGGTNYYNNTNLTAKTATVTGLPVDASTVYVTLGSRISGTWYYNSYTYTANLPRKADLLTPTPGSQISTNSVTFTWGGGNLVGQYSLQVGTSVGGSNIYSGVVANTVTSAQVNNIPLIGGTIYVRLNSFINGVWQYNDYTYTSVATATKAVITSPTPNTTLASSSVMFQWNQSGAAGYIIYVGSTLGAADILNSYSLSATTTSYQATVPANGLPVYVRLWSNLGTWQYNDYQYTAASGIVPVKAVLSTPTPGTVLPATNVTFGWNNSGASQYMVYVGSYLGGGDIANSGALASNVITYNVATLPTNGTTVYVRLWSLIGTWQYNDYTYTAFGALLPAVISSPAPNSTLTGSSVTFTWNNVGAANYIMWLGSTPGSSDIKNSGTLSSATTSYTTTVPTNGVNLYVRMFSFLNGTWKYNDYVFKQAGTVQLGTMVSPTPGSTLSGASVTFQWTGAGPAKYIIWIGTGVGKSDITNTGTMANTVNVYNAVVPVNGLPVYVRLWSLVNNNWVYQDYQYTAFQ